MSRRSPEPDWLLLVFSPFVSLQDSDITERRHHLHHTKEVVTMVTHEDTQEVVPAHAASFLSADIWRKMMHDGKCLCVRRKRRGVRSREGLEQKLEQRRWTQVASVLLLRSPGRPVSPSLSSLKRGRRLATTAHQPQQSLPPSGLKHTTLTFSGLPEQGWGPYLGQG